jgi:hypothetical protein
MNKNSEKKLTHRAGQYNAVSSVALKALATLAGSAQCETGVFEMRDKRVVLLADGWTSGDGAQTKIQMRSCSAMDKGLEY